MVYCSKCGAKNEDDAKTCAGCSAELYPDISRKQDYRERKQEEECFGLPQGRSIVGIIIGIIIILAGLSWSFGWDIDLWPVIVIIVGVLFISGAIYGLGRRRS